MKTFTQWGIATSFYNAPKSFFVPLGIFLLSYLYQIPGTGFVAPLFLSVLYTLFCGLGLGIGFLLDYAFAKEGQK